MGGSRFFVDHSPIQFGGIRSQVVGSATARASPGVDGVNRVLGPRMQRPHDEHQIQTRRWRLHVRKPPVWRRHWRPWEIIWVQKWTLSAVRCRRRSRLQKNGHCRHSWLTPTLSSNGPRLRVQKLDQEREAETELLNSALQRQVRLREQIAAEPSAVVHPAPSDTGDELARLRAKVAQLEAKSQHKSSSQRIRGSCPSSEDQRRQAQRSWLR